MMICYPSFILSLVTIFPLVRSFSPVTSAFDAYGLKLASNDLLMVESLTSRSSFLLRLAPFNYTLTCTVPYNDSNQYVFAVALPSHMTSNDTLRFVFIGIDQNTDVPFIGSLTYTGVSGETFIATINATRNVNFPCTGWQSSNYRIHHLDDFTDNGQHQAGSNNFFVVTVA